MLAEIRPHCAISCLGKPGPDGAAAEGPPESRGRCDRKIVVASGWIEGASGGAMDRALHNRSYWHINVSAGDASTRPKQPGLSRERITVHII